MKVDGMEKVFSEIVDERKRCIEAFMTEGNIDIHNFDRYNSQNDWVAYIATYAGRASDKVHSNVNSEDRFRKNMIKVANLAIAAIQAHDAKFC